MRFLSISPYVLLTLLGHWATFTLSIGSQTPLHDYPHSTSTSSLLDLHKSLVEHSSITGSEANCTDFLAAYLRSQNFTVEIQKVAKSRGNVFAYVGSSRKTRTLITSHIDVVPPFWPYERRGNEIWGRGSVDAKGSVATQIKAVESLLGSSSIFEGDVALLYVVGEETGGDGMRAANALGLTWETVIFGEPTELKLCAGHKGAMSLTVNARGKAGHSGYPELGKSATGMLINGLYSLQRAELPSSEKFGNTTLNIGWMQGGVAANVIAEEASAKIQLRIAAGTPQEVRSLIVGTVKAAQEELEVVFHSEGYGPVELDHDVKGKWELSFSSKFADMW